MDIIKKQGVWHLFDKIATLILTDEKQLETIIEDPCKPLFDNYEKGFSGEQRSLYPPGTSLVDICRMGREQGAQRLEVSYDFFFGGNTRKNYPDSDITIKAFKVIHDLAKEHGLKFSASVISPLDIGGGYAQKYDDTGYTCQFQEGAIDENGNYSVEMVLQRQWYNNKGPISLQLERILVYAFKEERIKDTCYYYVDPERIVDISATAKYQVDPNYFATTGAGYGYGNLKVFGHIRHQGVGDRAQRCLVVAVYKLPELNYFSPQALPYIKEVVDKHYNAGISYSGFYSDEMHIQFDWDLSTHFGHEDIHTRYMTKDFMEQFAQRYGEQYLDFYKYLVYFAYHQHDFMENDEGQLASQHVFGRNEKAIYQTWLFRKRYFEMLQDRVVNLCIAAKEYAESLYKNPIMTRAHATWQESPTCDRFYDAERFSKERATQVSRYDYTTSYVWSSSIRENMAACYDYFKWNDFLTGSGTDHPEGGNIDRNYYAQALACSFGVLNKYPYAYCGSWGSPKEVLRRLCNVGITYGNMGWEVQQGHNIVQGISHRLTDVLALYPLELNYIEERFGSWMVQYGYCNYITEDKLLENAKVTPNGTLSIKGREYRALVVLFEPFIKLETLDLLRDFLNCGGKVIWISMPPVLSEEGEDILHLWKDVFGISEVFPPYQGVAAKDAEINFEGALGSIAPMKVLTDMLPDYIYPVELSNEADIIARWGDKILGGAKEYPEGGKAVYLAFRPRDDQSCSTGQDIDTLFSILKVMGCYSTESLEAASRPEKSRYIIQQFPNGAISVANHYRTFYEAWSGEFFRDEKKDAEFLKNRTLPSVNIELNGKKILGRTIIYKGKDVLTYNVDRQGRLIGFAGNHTTGITIDGKSYQFAKEPIDIAWTTIQEPHRADGIKELYMVCANRPGRVFIPLPIQSFEGYRVEICDRMVFNTDRAIPYTWNGISLELELDEGDINKWIAVYQSNQ